MAGAGELTGSPYDGNGVRSPRWWPSRYGASDEIGAAQEVKPEAVRRALGLPREGRVFDLARVLDREIPSDPTRTYQCMILGHNALEQRWTGLGSTDVSSLEEYASHSYHIGTHVDGLAHVGIGDRFYNGRTYSELFELRGLTKLGAQNIPPLLTRGLLLDVAGVLSHPPMEGFPVEVAHLEAALAATQHGIEPGDAILIYTGWGELWSADPIRYARGEPGINESAAIWLAERRPCLVGSDNWALEVVPSPDRTRQFVVHQHLITVSGIYVLENLNLSELVRQPEREFLFVFSPVVAQGATGALVRPLAVL